MGLKEYGLTAQDGIMIHLLENERYQDDHVCPEAVTQPGIARILHTDRSYISYVLTQMTEKDLVDDRLRHVEGGKRKRKVYFLGENGRGMAVEIRSLLLDAKTSCIQNGEGLEGTFKELVVSTGLPLVTLAMITDPLVDVDIEDWISKEVEEPIEIRSPAVPLVPGIFVGRKNELDLICDWLSSDSRVLQITGLAGTGKTSLIGKAVERYGGPHVDRVYVPVRRWGGEVVFLSDLSNEMEIIGRRILSRMKKEKGSMSLEEHGQSLEVEIKKKPFLLMLDDAQFLMDDTGNSRVLDMLLDLCGYGLKILILSREKIRMDPRNLLDDIPALHFELMGLGRDDVKSFIESSNMDIGEEVYEITSGHPLYMTLLVNFHGDGSHFQAKKSMRDLIRNEVLSDLNHTEADILDLLSVARIPFSRRRLFDMDAGALLISEAGCSGLLDGGLLMGEDQEMNVHQMIKDIVLDIIPKKRRRELDMILSEHYRERLDMVLSGQYETSERLTDIREYLYHLMLCGSLSERASAVRDLGDELMSCSLTEDLERYTQILLDEMSRSREAEGVDPSIECTLLILNGWCLSVGGDWNRAMHQYSIGCQKASDIDDPDMLGRCENAMGTIHLRRGELDRARELIISSISRLKDKKSMCKARSNLAVVLWKQGELDNAIEEVDRSLDLALFLNDAMGVARGLINKGIIQAQKGDLDGSISSYERAMEICEKELFDHTLSIVHDNLGEALKLKGERVLSLEHFRKSLDIAMDLGFKWQIAETKRNIASITEEMEERNTLFKEAKDLFRSLGDLSEVERTDEMMNDE